MSISAIEEPQVVDIVVYRGSSFNRTIELEEEDPETGDLVPAKLSGYSGVGQILDRETDALVAEFRTAALEDDGKIPLYLQRSITAQIPAGRYVWGVTLVNDASPDTDTTTILVGDVEVRKGRYVAPSGGS
jgi:hypothetical protein